MTQTAARRRWRMPGLGVGPQIVAMLLIVGLVGALAIKPTRSLLEQRDRVSQMANDLHQMRSLNHSLERRIQRLQDPDFIEQQAREQIGLVRPGETAFVVSPPVRKAGDTGGRSRRGSEAPPPPRAPSLVEGFFEFIGLR